jgi:chromosome segregation ATPase
MILIQMDVSETPPDNEFSALLEEVARLRRLVGPSEKSYEDLERDAVGARDAARKAELETGQLRAQIVELENEVRRWQRDFVWFRDRFVRKVPLVGRFVARFRRL